MKSILSQLQDNDAILLMYLADELPTEDRAEVDRRLAADDALRVQLGQLKESDALVAKAAELPADGAGVDRTIRRTIAAMRQRQAELASRPAPVVESSRLRLPWWCYPVAAAAAVILAAAVFFANIEPRPEVPSAMEGAKVAAQDMVPWQTFSGLSDDPITAHGVAEEMIAAFDDSGAVLADSGNRGLAKAAREMELLNESSQAFRGAMDVTTE